MATPSSIIPSAVQLGQSETPYNIIQSSCQPYSFDVLYLDPPWRFKNWSIGDLTKYGEKWARRNGRSPYPVMSPDDLKRLPIGDLGNRNSLMFMWATYPKLDEALELMAIYGYKFTTVGFTWVKLNPSGMGWHFGMGYHTRGNAEICLLGKRGKGLKRMNNSVPNLVVWPRGEHSAKPPIVRDSIVSLVGPDTSKAELFARDDVHPGYCCWGNEVPYDEGFGSLNDYLAPPYEAIVDEDEFMGLPPGQEEVMEISAIGQMRLM